MRRKLAIFGATLVIALVSLGGSCRVSHPQGAPEERCVADCKKRAAAHCSEEQCIRGCRFVLDRLLEREGPTVVACVAKGGVRGGFPTSNSGRPRTKCDDLVWANCAVNLGVHADGGPPEPAPPEEWE